MLCGVVAPCILPTPLLPHVLGGVENKVPQLYAIESEIFLEGTRPLHICTRKQRAPLMYKDFIMQA